MLSCVLYIGALTLLALHPIARAAALASSPAGVAHGHLPQLLSSGLIVDGPAVPQIVALAVVLVVATRRLGTALTWRAGIGAHVGATLLAYLFVAVVWLADPGLAQPVMRAPDYGVSVVFAGVCGAMLGRHRPALVAPTVAALAAVWLTWSWLAAAFNPLVLANLEHLLGFAIGALTTVMGRHSSGVNERESPCYRRTAGLREGRVLVRSDGQDRCSMSSP